MVTVLSSLALAGSAIFFAASGDNPSDQSGLASNPDSKESKVLVADNRDEKTKSSRREAAADEDRSEETKTETVDSSADTDATSDESLPDEGDAPSALLATAGGHEIRLRKVDGVAQMQKSIKLDPGKLLAQGNNQTVTRSSQSGNQGSSFGGAPPAAVVDSVAEAARPAVLRHPVGERLSRRWDWPSIFSRRNPTERLAQRRTLARDLEPTRRKA